MGKRYKEGLLVIMRARLPFFSITILLVVLFPSFLVPNSASALGAEPPRIGGHTEDGHAVVDGEYGDHESDPDSSSSDHLPADDIPRLTADMQADPVSDSYKSADTLQESFTSERHPTVR